MAAGPGEGKTTTAFELIREMQDINPWADDMGLLFVTPSGDASDINDTIMNTTDLKIPLQQMSLQDFVDDNSHVRNCYVLIDDCSAEFTRKPTQKLITMGNTARHRTLIPITTFHNTFNDGFKLIRSSAVRLFPGMRSSIKTVYSSLISHKIMSEESIDRGIDFMKLISDPVNNMNNLTSRVRPSCMLYQSGDSDIYYSLFLKLK